MKFDDQEREGGSCPHTQAQHTLLPLTDLAAHTHMDDEYAWAGVEDPKVVVTTSHDPSSRLKQFAKVGGSKIIVFIIYYLFIVLLFSYVICLPRSCD